MVGTFRLLEPGSNTAHIQSWAHGAPGEIASSHLMVPFWYPSVTIWRDWTSCDAIADVRLRVHGPQPKPYLYSQNSSVELIGLAIAPEFAADILELSAAEISSQFIDYEGREAEGLLELAGNGASVQDLATELVAHFGNIELDSRRDDFEMALDTLRRSNGAATVSAISASAGISERQFRKRFKDRIGISAKSYSRMLRANALVGASDRLAKPEWADLASQFGYFDQAHMINDLKGLTGMAPARLHWNRRNETRWPRQSSDL